MITSQQIIDKSKKAGIPITKRTFEYYQRLGFLPKPHHKVKGEKGKGVYGYYDNNIIACIKTVYQLKKKGYSLKEIKKRLEGMVLEEYEKVLREWGLSSQGGTASIAIGWSPPPACFEGNTTKLFEEVWKERGISSIKTIRSLMSKYNLSEEEKDKYNKKAMERMRSHEKQFEAYILKRLNWWDSKEKIEYKVLSHSCEVVNGAISGLSLALMELKRDIDKFKITYRIYELSELRDEMEVRILKLGKKK